jgi:porin
VAAQPAVLDDLLTRPTLSGDWFGARSLLAKRGIAFDLNVTQITQGVVDGGKDSSWEYGGRGNLTVNLDTQKLGLWPGGFLTLEVEGNWTDAVNGKTGALMPVNTNQLFPLPVGDNLAVPNLTFAQFLSPYAGLIVGKMDTLIGDANEFAHGKGDKQFFNTALSINPVALVVPYSTLGGGAIVLPTKDPEHAMINLFVFSATGKATTAGFDELDSDNLIFSGQGRLRTDFFGLTGHQLVGAFFSNREYNSIDQRLGFVVENRRLRPSQDSWAVFYNFDQYLYEIDQKAGRGAGLFGRFGASEGNPNPAEYFFSIGAGGKGVVPHRDLDRFGVGFYYILIENPMLQTPFTTRTYLGDEWGVEIFYNVAVTPWMLLTPDLQIIGPAQQRRATGLRAREPIDTAVVLGVRLQLIF